MMLLPPLLLPLLVLPRPLLLVLNWSLLSPKCPWSSRIESVDEYVDAPPLIEPVERSCGCLLLRLLLLPLR